MAKDTRDTQTLDAFPAKPSRGRPRKADALLLEKTAQGDLLAAPASSKPRMTGEEMLNELHRSAGLRQR